MKTLGTLILATLLSLPAAAAVAEGERGGDRDRDSARGERDRERGERDRDGGERDRDGGERDRGDRAGRPDRGNHVHPGGEIRRDLREIRRDKRQLRRDRREVRGDKRELRGDRQEIREDLQALRRARATGDREAPFSLSRSRLPQTLTPKVPRSPAS